MKKKILFVLVMMVVLSCCLTIVCATSNNTDNQTIATHSQNQILSTTSKVSVSSSNNLTRTDNRNNSNSLKTDTLNQASSKYTQSNNISTLKSYSNTNTTINIENNTYPKVSINGKLTNITEGTLNIKICNNNIIQSQNLTLNDEKWNTTFTNLNAGKYSVVVSYYGNDYNGSINSTTFNVNQLNTTITVDSIKAVEIYDSIIIKGKLVDEYNNPLATKTITVLINDESNTVKTDNNGKYNLTTIAAEGGVNNIIVSYSGDTNYASSNANTTVNVKLPSVITVDVSDYIVNIGDSAIITGNLIDINENAIANAEIILIINGVNYKTVTKNDGTFTYNYTTTTAKNGIKVVAQFNGNDKFTSSKESTIFYVEKMNSNIIIDPIDTTVVNSTVVVSGKLVKEFTSIPITNAKITVISNNVTYTKTTDAQGKYKVITKAPSTNQTVDVKVIFTGDNTYLSTNTTTTYDVEKIITKISVNNIGTVKMLDNITVKGKLVDELNNTLTNKNVLISINGKKSTVKTGNNGVYEFKTTATQIGVNNITVSYDGDTGYESITKTSNFTITKGVAIISCNNITAKLGDIVTINANIKDIKGNKIKSGNAIIKINGKTLGKVNVTSGIISYKLNLTTKNFDKNNYKITFTYNGNENYSSTTKDTILKVTGLKPIFKVSTTSNAYIEDTITITLKVTSGTEYAENGSVGLQINGKTYTINQKAVTQNIVNKKATFKVNATKYMAGKNNITITYTGNNKFNSGKTTITNAFTVQNKTRVTSTVNKTSGTLGQKIILSAKFTTKKGVLIKSGKATVKINGLTLGYATINNGIAKYTLYLNPTKYNGSNNNITFTYGGSTIYSSATANAILTINKYTPKFTYTKITTKVGKTAKITVKITNSDKTFNSTSGTVGIKINGQVYKVNKKAVTVKIVNGMATFNIPITKNMTGNNNITFTYTGDNKFNSGITTITNGLIVKV